MEQGDFWGAVRPGRRVRARAVVDGLGGWGSPSIRPGTLRSWTSDLVSGEKDQIMGGEGIGKAFSLVRFKPKTR